MAKKIQYRQCTSCGISTIADWQVDGVCRRCRGLGVTPPQFQKQGATVGEQWTTMMLFRIAIRGIRYLLGG